MQLLTTANIRTDLQALDKAHVIKEYQTAIDAVNLMIDDEGAQ
jgi:hypothetical protein